MKITNTNPSLFAIVFFLVIAGIIVAIIFYAPGGSQDDVIVSYERPDSFDPVKSTQFNATPIGVASPTPIATATPFSQANAADSETADQWSLTIQDPLGDPIPSGTVAVGSESHSFTSGHLIIPATSPRELRVRVSAEGYSQGEFTVTPNSSPLVLDYLCDFSIRVEDEKGNPAPNTTIRVWKSNPPPRPVEDQATVYTRKGNSFRLKRNEEGCRVTWVSKPNRWYDHFGSSRHGVYPKEGDLLMALGACAWQNGYAPFYIHQERITPEGETFPLASRCSCRLRIWDSLSLAELTDSNHAPFTGFAHILDILRENQVQFYYLKFPECQENQPFLYEEKTNEKGEWRLHGVPPALYYVQAIGGPNRHSAIMPLYPACGGARLRLRGEGSLWVYVEKEGVHAKDKLFARVPDAEVIIQSSQKGIKAYAEKSDYEGEVRFEKLPYGEYRLLAKAQGLTVEKNITIKRSLDTCIITLPHEEFYKITGIVLDKDSGEPVSGFALELNTDSRAGFFGYRVYEEVITDANGRFEFNKVIPGKYCLSEDVKSLGDFEYIFSERDTGYGTFMESCTHLSNIDLNVYEDIHDLKILVEPVVKTNFSGIVVNEDGIPIENALFTIVPYITENGHRQKAQLHPEDFRTDASGLFSLTLFNDYRGEGERYKFDITAMTGRMPLTQWIPSADKPFFYSYVRERFHATSIGSVTVKGDMGDSFEDLRIVLEPHVTDKSLHGKLVAEGEEQFSPVGINATQKNKDVLIQLNEDGYFKADNIATGEMTLDINPEIRATVNTPSGPHEYYKYVSRRVTIQIEEQHPQTYVEIPLQRSGYYWGYVRDDNGNPLQGIAVWAEDQPSPHGHSFVTTDQNGFFFIGKYGLLVEGKSYNIKYDIGRHGKQVKVMPDVPLNTGDLLLR